MITFDKCSSFKGNIKVPSDKSITHRAIIMGAMTDGVSVVKNPLLSRDTIATMNVVQQLGVNIVNERSRLLIHSEGVRNFKEPYDVLNCDNSGTTARLMMGVLAPSKFYSVLSGDPSLLRRPMDRVIKPLSTLGANIKAKNNSSLLPATILPSSLKAGEIKAETKSAQVKGSILLAGAQLEGVTSYIETTPTRDHTERMLKAFGIKCENNNGKISVYGGEFTQSRIDVPSDFSSAAFFIGAGLIFEGSEIVIENCGLNPSRTGLLQALKELGVDIEYEITSEEIEPVGNIYVKPAQIKGGKISGEIIANMIDEIPVLAMIGLFGQAPLEIRDAKELRVKESDRIAALINNFKALGAEIEEYEDGLKIYPLTKEPEKATLLAYDDHRISMVNIILAKKFGVKVLMDNIASLDVSYPDFIGDLLSLEVK